MNEKIVDREWMLNLVFKECGNQYSLDEIEEICDIFMNKVYESFKEENSMAYFEDFPIFKVKRSNAHLDVNSPRTPRNDRVLVSMKIPLQVKTMKKGN